MIKYTRILLLLSIWFFSQKSEGQIQAKNYTNAVQYMYANYHNKTAFHLYTKVNWFEDGSGFWYLKHTKTSKTIYWADHQRRSVQKLIDLSDLKDAFARQDSLLSLDEFVPKDIVPKGKSKWEISYRGNRYVLDAKRKRVQQLEKKELQKNNPNQSLSPDGKYVAFVKDYNLYVREIATAKEFALTTDGRKGFEYATWYGWYDLIEGENGDRPPHFWVEWSPDSKYIMANVVDFSKAEKMYLLDYSVDSLYRPKLYGYYRGSPSDTTMVYQQPRFFELATKKEIATKLPKNTHINSVNVEWSGGSGELIASWAERGYKKQIVQWLDLKTGKNKDIITETSSTNIDGFSYREMHQGKKLVFLSERSGWKQLYVVDTHTAKIRSLTQGEFVVNSIVYVDEEKNQIFVLISGKDKGMNPYHQQLYRVGLDGSMQLLTPEKAHHQIQFAKNGKSFVDNYSTVQQPTLALWRSAKDGSSHGILAKANVEALLAKNWKAPTSFCFTAKDGKTTLYGALWKPSDFDPNKKYPLIDHSYSGPHTQMFPKSFDRALMNQSLAELGFVVMMVDGLGTAGRSKAFHDHSYQNMGANLEDHLGAIKYLSETYPWIDAEKIGIFGHSAGGYDTGRAMLVYPKTYKVGVASSADHDFRMEKAWWPEMYMGWPVDEKYHQVSNITNAHLLEGKLLLVHGGMDENVNPSATFKLAEALVKADKDFDLLIMPSQHHGYRGDFRKYFIKKRWNYFVEHLLGQKPIWDFKWE
ncbi:MAG: S9 family peptidase [Flavobacteriaceae bacterium]|nr:S9 family peptidase [Flavobacteriaceae bacterium]